MFSITRYPHQTWGSPLKRNGILFFEPPILSRLKPSPSAPSLGAPSYGLALANRASSSAKPKLPNLKAVSPSIRCKSAEPCAATSILSRVALADLVYPRLRTGRIPACRNYARADYVEQSRLSFFLPQANQPEASGWQPNATRTLRLSELLPRRVHDRRDSQEHGSC